MSSGSLMVGWPEIFKALGALPAFSKGYRRDEEYYGEYLEGKGRELESLGLPVWYLPELDDRPRIERKDAIAWARKRHEKRKLASAGKVEKNQA